MTRGALTEGSKSKEKLWFLQRGRVLSLNKRQDERFKDKVAFLLINIKPLGDFKGKEKNGYTTGKF